MSVSVVGLLGWLLGWVTGWISSTAIGTETSGFGFITVGGDVSEGVQLLESDYLMVVYQEFAKLFM